MAITGNVSPNSYDIVPSELVGGLDYAAVVYGASNAGGTLPDPMLTLLDSEFNVLGQNDDSFAFGRDPFLQFQAPYTGTFYFAIEDYYGDGGTYTFSNTFAGFPIYPGTGLLDYNSDEFNSSQYSIEEANDVFDSVDIENEAVIDLDTDTQVVLRSLDIDGNGGELQSSDYTLINLYASFGNDAALFDALLQNNSDILLGADAIRDDGEKITDYFNSVRDSVFDIDGNGTVETSDYTLIDLYGSFGADTAVLDSFLEQSRDVLIGEGATRITSTAIVDYFTQSLSPSDE
jgi:hypothetical protein